MDIVVDVLQRQEPSVRTFMALFGPLGGSKLPPSIVIVGTKHTVDRVCKGSWVPLEVRLFGDFVLLFIFLILTLFSGFLVFVDGVPGHVGEMIVGYPGVVHTLKAHESLCVLIHEDTVSACSCGETPLISSLVW